MAISFKTWPGWVQVQEDMLTGETLLQVSHGERRIQFRLSWSATQQRGALEELIRHGKQRLIKEQATVDAVAAKLLAPPTHAKK